MLKAKNAGKSLVFKTSVRIMLIVIILIAVLILSYVYSLRVITNNMLSSVQNTAAIYINNIENSLNSVTKELNEISLKYIDTIVNYKNMGEFQRYYASIQVREALVTKLVSNDNLDGLFILQPDDDIFLYQFGSRITKDESDRLANYLKSKSFYENKSGDTLWNILQLGGTSYLLKKYTVSGFAAGVLVKADTLMSFIRKSSAGNNIRYFLTDKDGRVLSCSKQFTNGPAFAVLPNGKAVLNNFNGGNILVTADIAMLHGKLSSIVENKNVFRGLEAVQWIIVILGVASVFIIPYVLYYLYRGIIKPIRALVAATKEIEAGNWSVKLPRHDTPLEFITLNNSFESMVKEIKSLKINTYEEKIERQKAELKYLRMQIRPHFYLNAITTISSLTYQNRNEEIRRFIDLLSKHIRYMFKGGLAMVPISEEIDHVKNYIGIMEIKYPNNIFYMIDIEPDSENFTLPQFLIQTFVENIFKHALTVNVMLSIFIKVEKYCREETGFYRIVIEDNGDGFPPEIIDIVNNACGDGGNGGEKIGITNIKKTLSLLYKRDDLLKITNCEPKGARVEIFIPEDKEESNESAAG